MDNKQKKHLLNKIREKIDKRAYFSDLDKIRFTIHYETSPTLLLFGMIKIRNWHSNQLSYNTLLNELDYINRRRDYVVEFIDPREVLKVKSLLEDFLDRSICLSIELKRVYEQNLAAQELKELNDTPN